MLWDITTIQLSQPLYKFETYNEFKNNLKLKYIFHTLTNWLWMAMSHLSFSEVVVDWSCVGERSGLRNLLVLYIPVYCKWSKLFGSSIGSSILFLIACIVVGWSTLLLVLLRSLTLKLLLWLIWEWIVWCRSCWWKWRWSRSHEYWWIGLL